jgi:hypothetical protein
VTPEEAETKLLAACREAVKRGMRIVPCTPGSDDPNCCCPLGALRGAEPGNVATQRYPIPYVGSDVAEFNGLGFHWAFDGDESGHGDLAPLGRKFRALALSGGFDA